MKGMIKKFRCFLNIFLIILLFFIISGCNGITTTNPVIKSFTADSNPITEGENVTLNWEVTNATAVFIDQGIGLVELSDFIIVAPTSTTTYTLTAANSIGSSTALVKVVVHQTAIIQPGLEEGKDSMVHTIALSNNYGSESYLKIGNNDTGVRARDYLQFNLNAIPSNVVLIDAKLMLYQYETTGQEGFVVGLHQVTENWEESIITWNNQPDFLLSPESTVIVSIGNINWLSWDITPLMHGWLNGTTSNYGVLLKDLNETSIYSFIQCYSSNYTIDPSRCPKLEINYYLP